MPPVRRRLDRPWTKLAKPVSRRDDRRVVIDPNWPLTPAAIGSGPNAETAAEREGGPRRGAAFHPRFRASGSQPSMTWRTVDGVVRGAGCGHRRTMQRHQHGMIISRREPADDGDEVGDEIQRIFESRPGSAAIKALSTTAFQAREKSAQGITNSSGLRRRRMEVSI